MKLEKNVVIEVTLALEGFKLLAVDEKDDAPCRTNRLSACSGKIEYYVFDQTRFGFGEKRYLRYCTHHALKHSGWRRYQL